MKNLFVLNNIPEISHNILPELKENIAMAMRNPEYSFNMVKMFCAMWVDNVVAYELFIV